MKLIGDILKCENVLYDAKIRKFLIEDKYIEDFEKIKKHAIFVEKETDIGMLINNGIGKFIFFDNFIFVKNFNDYKIDQEITDCLYIHSIHFCYAHAVYDSVVKYFGTIKDIGTDINDMNIFINDYEFKNWNEHFKHSVDLESKNFTGFFRELFDTVSNKPPIFEHLLTNEIIKINNAYFYQFFDFWQRSIWNCQQNYPGRVVDISQVLRTDEVLYKTVRDYRDHVFNKYNIKYNETLTEKNLVILSRRDHRRFNDDRLNQILEFLPQVSNIKFNGIKYLEGLNLLEQIEIFNNNNIFISEHGSQTTNLLFAPKNFTLIEIDYDSHKRMMHNRICKISESYHHHIGFWSDEWKNILKDINGQN